MAAAPKGVAAGAAPKAGGFPAAPNGVAAGVAPNGVAAGAPKGDAAGAAPKRPPAGAGAAPNDEAPAAGAPNGVGAAAGAPNPAAPGVAPKRPPTGAPNPAGAGAAAAPKAGAAGAPNGDPAAPPNAGVVGAAPPKPKLGAAGAAPNAGAGAGAPNAGAPNILCEASAWAASRRSTPRGREWARTAVSQVVGLTRPQPTTHQPHARTTNRLQTGSILTHRGHSRELKTRSTSTGASLHYAHRGREDTAE